MNNPNLSSDSIREHVENAYTNAINRLSKNGHGKGCCGTNSTTITELMGYSRDELQGVPTDVATSSFGCGNPLAFADVREGQTVIDLGSGAGLDLLLASRAVGPAGRVIGIDMTDAMIDSARKNITDAGITNVEIRKGLIECLPVYDASADWVISNCVISLSPEKTRVFSEIARVLKPGGIMQISDIVVQDLPDWARKNQDMFNACLGGAISEKEYLDGLRDAGLTDVVVINRLNYSASQIKDLLNSQSLPVSPEGLAALGMVNIDDLAEMLATRVWSAKIRAVKPVSEAS